MLKIVAFMLLLSVVLFAKAQENQGGSYAENYNIQSRQEGTESNNNQNVRNNQNENEKENNNRNENRNGNENWNGNERWNVNENENGDGNVNWNGNENGKKKCDGEGHSNIAENNLERLIDESTGQEYEIIGYLYPPNPPAQPYYYEVPLMTYEK